MKWLGVNWIVERGMDPRRVDVACRAGRFALARIGLSVLRGTTRNRTEDLLGFNQPLFHLSYGPLRCEVVS